MMNSGDSEPAVNWDFILENVDFTSWFDGILANDAMVNSCEDATPTNPNNPSQPSIPTINGGTSLGGESLTAQNMNQNQVQLQQATGTLSNQNQLQLQQATGTSGNQNQLQLQQATGTSGNQNHLQLQHATGTSRDLNLLQLQQATGTSGNQNQLQLQQAPGTSGNKNQLQLQQATGTSGNQNQLQLQQATGTSGNQNQLQLQQTTRTSGYLISGGAHQQGNYIDLNFSGPNGFATPGDFLSATAYNHYILRQIKVMKERYYNELLKMHYNANELRTRATNVDDMNYYKRVIACLERIMSFLNISRADALPENHQMIYNTMNTIVNFVSYHMNMPGCYSLYREPAHQPPNRQQVQPLGAMRLQNNPSPNPSQSVANLEADAWNFNHDLPSQRPHQQPAKSLMLSAPKVTSFQIATYPSVLNTTQQINLGPMISSAIMPGYQMSLFSNTTVTDFPSRPLNHQPPVANQSFNFEKMKAPMHETIKLTRSKVPHGMSPLCSGLVNQGPTVNPISQQTSTSTSKVGVNGVLSPHSTVDSPFLLSSNSSASSKTPMDPPSQEPETAKDQSLQLTKVVKPVSTIALNTSLTDISSTEKVMDIVPDSVPSNLVSTHIQDKTNVVLEYDHQSLQKRKHELCVPAVCSDQFVSKGCDVYSASVNKRKKNEKKCAILAEIKTINSKLVETFIDAIDPSEDGINILGAHEGTIVKCLFKNVCYLLEPQKGAPSEKMPAFLIVLLVPDDYPASSPRIIKSRRDVLNYEPWGKLYGDMLTKFNLSLCGITGTLSLEAIARKWDASARAIVTEFLQKRGGKNFGARYGSWDICMNSSSSSN